VHSIHVKSNQTAYSKPVPGRLNDPPLLRKSSMVRSPLVDLANVASFGQYIKDATLLSFYNRAPWHGSL